MLFRSFPARSAGISQMNSEKIGRACLFLGGGRSKAEDKIDFAVGVSDLKKVGGKIDRGEPLMRVHARTDRSLEEVLPLLKEAAVIE